MPLYVLGPGSLLDDMMRECGGVNVACDLGRASGPFAEELVLARRPDWILLRAVRSPRASRALGPRSRRRRGARRVGGRGRPRARRAAHARRPSATRRRPARAASAQPAREAARVSRPARSPSCRLASSRPRSSPRWLRARPSVWPGRGRPGDVIGALGGGGDVGSRHRARDPPARRAARPPRRRRPRRRGGPAPGPLPQRPGRAVPGRRRSRRLPRSHRGRARCGRAALPGAAARVARLWSGPWRSAALVFTAARRRGRDTGRRCSWRASPSARSSRPSPRPLLYVAIPEWDRVVYWLLGHLAPRPAAELAPRRAASSATVRLRPSSRARPRRRGPRGGGGLARRGPRPALDGPLGLPPRCWRRSPSRSPASSASSVCSCRTSPAGSWAPGTVAPARPPPLGGGLLVLADGVARAVHPPLELPVGVVTAAIGAPFLAWILLRAPRRVTTCGSIGSRGVSTQPPRRDGTCPLAGIPLAFRGRPAVYPPCSWSSPMSSQTGRALLYVILFVAVVGALLAFFVVGNPFGSGDAIERGRRSRRADLLAADAAGAGRTNPTR